MYGYSFGCAKADVWHITHSEHMLYPGYETMGARAWGAAGALGRCAAGTRLAVLQIELCAGLNKLMLRSAAAGQEGCWCSPFGQAVSWGLKQSSCAL